MYFFGNKYKLIYTNKSNEEYKDKQISKPKTIKILKNTIKYIQNNIN
jgi:hypothetical protein